MNYLFHLYLSEPTVEGWVGSLMGDFVKGRLDERYPAAIRQGIELHRRVDTFAHDNSVIRRSRQRLEPSFRHYRSILIDVFFDHFLAKNWEDHARVPLPHFAQQVYRALESHQQLLPPALQRIVPRMIAHNWLESYRDIETMDIVLARLSSRIPRTNPLAEGGVELLRNYQDLQGDFRDFLPVVRAFANQVNDRAN